MRSNRIVIIIFTMFSILIALGCEKSSTGPEDEDSSIPLDGRGGGVIAYCYQPLQDGMHQIYAVNADGSGNRKLIMSSYGLNHLDWAPNGHQIACVGYVNGDFSTWSIHTFNVDGTDLTRLTTQIGVWDNEPRWSPDGSQIAFVRIYPSNNNKEEIWMMNADGSNQRYIGIEGFIGGWHPDGTRLIYVTVINGNYEVCTCLPDGTDIRQITNNTVNEISPSYSPDGNQIVFDSFEGTLYTNTNAATYEIFVMNADGTDRRQLTDNERFDGSARWSPDGNHLAFSSGLLTEENLEIYIMNMDGSNVRSVTNSPAGITAINPVWRPGE